MEGSGDDMATVRHEVGKLNEQDVERGRETNQNEHIQDHKFTHISEYLQWMRITASAYTKRVAGII